MNGGYGNIVLYVVGEIFFVVIGILLAFQVDNWNEERKLRREEMVLLKALKEEIDYNAKQVAEVIDHSDRSRQSAQLLLEIYQKGFQQYKPETLDSLLAQVQWAWTFNPKISVLSAIKVSGKLNSIQNREVQKFIVSFEELASDSEEESLIIRSLIVDKYALALSKYLSVSARSKYLGYNLGESKFKSDYAGLFNDRQIESLVAYIYIWRETEFKELNRIHQLLLDDIVLVDTEIAK
jgi:hypothetical protein